MSQDHVTNLASENLPGLIAEDYQTSRSLTWRPFINEKMREKILEVVPAIAERLVDPNHLQTIAKQAEQQASSFFWSGSSLATGLPGVVLAFLYLSRAFPDQGWEQRAHLYIRVAAESTTQQPLMQPGMFGGTSGLAMTLLLLSRTDERYQKTSKKLTSQLCSQVLEKQWRRTNGEVITSDFDVINGASGILAYLLSTKSEETAIQDAVYKLLEYLVWLAGDDEKTGRERWFIEPQYYPVKQYHQQYPNGFFDCGLAHGIPGPLAALSLAQLTGYQVEGQQDAILKLGTWMKNHTVQDQSGGISWPAGIPLELSYSANLWGKIPPTRTAWCYGTPGISRALWLAGKALKNKDFCDTSIHGIESVIQLATNYGISILQLFATDLQVC